MDKLHEAMQKVLEVRGSLDGGRSAPGGEEGWSPLRPGEPLVAVEKIEVAAWSERHLLDGRVVTPSLAGRYARSTRQRAIETFRMIRTRTLHAAEAPGDTARVLAITSPHQGDGKTLVAINLAISMAHQPPKNLLLVDADLRSPSVAKTLGLRPRYGLSDYLAGEVPLESCMLKAPDRNLFVLPQLGPLPNSSELLANGALAALTRTIRQWYPEWIVVIDCPPILVVDDALVILRAVDKAILVVREGKTAKSELRRAAETIGRDRYLGTVLNDSRVSGSESGYRYGGYR
jgi:capsular exopolysaccharide synthesis family protein